MLLFEIMIDLPLYLFLMVFIVNNIAFAWNLLWLRLRTTLI